MTINVQKNSVKVASWVSGSTSCRGTHEYIRSNHF